MNDQTFLYYQNGFKDGQAAPIYFATGLMGFIQTMTHDLEALQGEIECAASPKTNSILIYKFLPDTWEAPKFICAYDWNVEKKRYIKREYLKN